MKSIKLLTLPKLLLLISAILLIIFNLLHINKIINYNLYGWNENIFILILISIFYILIPFSVKSGLWSKLWALFILLFSIILIIGLFIGQNLNFKSIWIYFNTLPHIISILGSILWILNNE